jgi:hypothetical protein
MMNTIEITDLVLPGGLLEEIKLLMIAAVNVTAIWKSMIMMKIVRC